MSSSSDRPTQPESLRPLAPAVCLDPLLEQLSGDREQLAYLLQLFLEDLPGRVASLEAAVAARDPEQLRRAAHPMKGAAAQLGAEPARQVLNELEEAGRRRDLTQVDELAKGAQMELTRLRGALEEVLRGGTP